MDVLKIIRDSCKDFQPYTAGKPIETVKRELGLKRIIKMASNENPLGPSKLSTDAVRKILKDVFYYPDSNSYLLKEALSRKYNLPSENIFVGSGGDELIEIIAKLFFNPEDEIVMSKHTFVRYDMAVKLMGAHSIAAPMKDGFKHDLNGMLKICSRNTKAIVIVNPNNPTGTYITKDEFSEFLQNVPPNMRGVKPLIIADEAYFEYAAINEDYPNALDFLKDNDNLIIIRTFSKAYGLAGLRVGYGFADKNIVDFIERIRPPFNVNILAQSAAAAALKDKSQISKSQNLVKKGRNYLYKEFGKMGLEYLESAANFVLFKSPIGATPLFEELLKEGVIVRAMDEYELPDWARVTVGLDAENKIFIEKLKKVLGK